MVERELLRRGRAAGAIATLFLIFLLIIRAVGVWLPPSRSGLEKVEWVPFVITAVGLAALLTILLAPYRKRQEEDQIRTVSSLEKTRDVELPIHQIENRTRVESALGLFFWILIVFLLIAIAINYLFFS